MREKPYLWGLGETNTSLYCMKKHLLHTIAALTLGFLNAEAQESSSVFNFLNLPTSAHATALGGTNISLIEDDASLTFQNPALASSVSNNSIGVNFSTLMRGQKAASASFTRLQGERGTWGINAQMVGYGSIEETSAAGEIEGDCHPIDVALSGLYSYFLSDRLSGGAAGKLIYSNYAGYTSFAMAVDLGLNYYVEESDFSVSVVAANLGGQIKAFGDEHEHLPFQLNLGLTKRIAHAPLRLSLTMTDLTHWSKNYYYHTGSDPKGGRILLNHFNVGVDLVPSNLFWVGIGWNCRRAYELEAAGSSKMAGLTAGAGLNIKKLSLGVSYAKYHVSAPSLSIGVSYKLTK